VSGPVCIAEPTMDQRHLDMEAKILIAGASGFIGGLVVERLASTEHGAATCLVRRAMQLDARTLVTDFSEPPAALDAAYDAVFLCLGTTPSRAGGKAEFHRVEHDLAVTVARWAAERGAHSCAYVSSLGADLKSASLYLRTKAETERSLAAIGFDALHLFRPSFLTGRVPPLRSERIGALLCRALAASGLGPKSGALTPIAGAVVADAMLATLDFGGRGTQIYHYADMLRLSARV
jgi:uncharacterized protein YbjT (DUF2867 family)